MLLDPKEQPCHRSASPCHPPPAQSCAASPDLPGPRDPDPQGMQAALKRMVRNTSLPKTGFREIYIWVSNRRVKTGVEKFGKTMEEALSSSWGFQSLHCALEPLQQIADCPSVLLSLFPSVGAASFLSSWLPGHSDWFGKKDAAHSRSPGMLGTATQKASDPQIGESGYWGKWSWWWRAGREIQQLLELREATFACALLGSLSDAQMGNRWEEISKYFHPKREGIQHGTLYAMGTQRPNTHERHLFGVNESELRWQARWWPLLPLLVINPR